MNLNLATREEVVGSTMIMGYGKKQRKINIYEAVRL
jgi:hypothetical protein